MSKPKLTPWFDGNVKPVRVGVYQSDGLGWQFWNGQEWGLYCMTKKDAYKDRLKKSIFQGNKWRGLAGDHVCDGLRF